MTEASHQMASNPLPPARAQARLGRRRRPAPRSASSTRPGTTSRGRRGRGRDPRARASRPATSTTPRRTPSRSSTAGSAPATAASLRRDGYLRLEGRLKEMILRGGENISPYEIEDVLLGAPGRRRRGLLRHRRREVRRAGRRGGRARAATRTERELDRALPRAAGGVQGARASIHVLDAIPRTPTGKVQRKRVGASAARGATDEVRVLGAGAIGAYVGAALARGGGDVTLIARGAHLRGACSEHGVRVLSPRGDFEAHPRGDRRPRRDRATPTSSSSG